MLDEYYIVVILSTKPLDMDCIILPSYFTITNTEYELQCQLSTINMNEKLNGSYIYILDLFYLLIRSGKKI